MDFVIKIVSSNSNSAEWNYVERIFTYQDTFLQKLKSWVMIKSSHITRFDITSDSPENKMFLMRIWNTLRKIYVKCS